MILEISTEDQRMNQDVLFREKFRIDFGEQQQYAEVLHVKFTSKAMNKGPMIELNMKKFLGKVQQLDNLCNAAWLPSSLRWKPEVTNHGSSKLSSEPENTIQFLLKKKVLVSTVPKGCTP